MRRYMQCDLISLQSNAIAWVFASTSPRLMSLHSLAICANPMCTLLPPPFDSPSLVFEERELRRLVQVWARNVVPVQQRARLVLATHATVIQQGCGF